MRNLELSTGVTTATDLYRVSFYDELQFSVVVSAPLKVI